MRIYLPFLSIMSIMPYSMSNKLLMWYMLGFSKLKCILTIKKHHTQWWGARIKILDFRGGGVKHFSGGRGRFLNFINQCHFPLHCKIFEYLTFEQLKCSKYRSVQFHTFFFSKFNILQTVSKSGWRIPILIQIKKMYSLTWPMYDTQFQSYE